MTNDPELNRRIRHVLERFTKFQKAILCLRLLIWLAIYRVRCLVQRLTPSRARIHWIGHYRRRRLERHLIILLFLCAVIFLEPHEFALWSAIWGGATAFFIVFYTIYLLVPRKRAHWVNR
jgi:hypothetical protein